MPSKRSYLTVTDQFCGAGGSSIGAVAAGVELRMALNHWALAIETHNSNFPTADHDCTDISACDPRRYPSTDILITSPECTNHSLAKGKRRKGLDQSDLFLPSPVDPTEERSRATMWDVPRFAEFHDYNLIIVENVVDARRWVQFPAWLHAMKLLGYRHRCVYLNSQFCWPTPQSRDRMYVVFWKRGNRAPDLDFRPPAPCAKCGEVEAVQSWKPGRRAGKYRQQYVYCCPSCAQEVQPYYYAALNAIDWSIPAERIGDRSRPLRPRTLERIRYGLERYGRQPLVVRTNMTSGIGCRVRAAGLEPLDTQPGSAITALVHPWLVQTSYAGAGAEFARSAAGPMGTQTTCQDVGVAYPPAFLATAGSRENRPLGLAEASPTFTGSERFGLVVNPASVITLRDYKKIEQLVHSPAHPLTTQVAAGQQHALVSPTPYLVTYMGQSEAHPLDGPIPTLPTREREALVQPQTADVDDCYFRMLQPHEIQAGMAFPGDYVVLGTKRQQVKQLGNAVTPPAMEWLIRQGVASLN